jgi:hypothetical protein
MENPDFIYPFKYKGESYTARIWHYSQLSIKDRLDHRMVENSYLVYLSGPRDYKPFEVFIGEDFEWHTPSNFAIDDELVQVIGLHIHNKTL